MKNTKLDEIKKYMDELRIVESTQSVISEGKFLRVAVADYKLANNKAIRREEIVKKNNDAVVILPVTNEGNIVLVIQPRPLTKNGVTIEIPAGYIDFGETGAEAAMRELLEETGYMPTRDLIKTGEYYQDQGCSRGINKSYLALGCQRIKEQSLDNDEYVKYFECTYQEMLELIDMGYISSANTLLTIKLGEQQALNYINRNLYIKTKRSDSNV